MVDLGGEAEVVAVVVSGAEGEEVVGGDSSPSHGTKERKVVRFRCGMVEEFDLTPTPTKLGHHGIPWR